VSSVCVFADADKVVGDLLHFSERDLDDELVPEKQLNDDPPALPAEMAESVKSTYLISLVFCRPDQCSRNSSVDNISRLISE
jgi:hypothetical protein